MIEEHHYTSFAGVMHGSLGNATLVLQPDGLVVLVDRGGRELPIRPDFVGLILNLPPAQRVNVYLTEMGRPDEVAIESGPPERS